MSGLTRVLQAAFGTPWAIQPEKLEAIAEVLAFQAAGGHLTPAQIDARVGDRKNAPLQGAGIAVLPLYGIVGHRMNQVQDISGPGGTSAEQFGGWFEAALNDPAISAIVIDIDSPGGTVTGVQELAAQIYDARGQKPIIAMANAMAASAAYWIAAAADEMWVIPSGEVGSIGVYAMHRDKSGMEAEAGVKTTLISAGKFKVEGNPHEPLTDEARAAMQERVDEFYNEFTKAVALYRGVEQDAVINGYGEGRVLGAIKAKRAGLVDKIGAMDTLLSKLGGGKNRSRLSASTLTPLPLALTPSDAPALVASALLSDSPADVAAAPVVIPHATAPKAKEQPMAEENAAIAAAAAAEAKATAEHARIDGLLALAAEEGVAAADLKRWKMEGLSVETAQREIMSKLKAAGARRPALAASVSPLDGGDNGTAAGPFRTFGHQLEAIREHARNPGGMATNMLAAVQETYGAASGGSAGSGPDGGFLIQRDFVADLVKDTMSESELAKRCASIELSANSDSLETVSIQETSRVTGTRNGGMQVYRAAEADTVTATKPKIDRSELRIEDMRGIYYATDRLQRDAAAMGQVVEEAVHEEFSWLLDDEIYRGNGVGRCLGVTKADCRIEVAKESGQAADTVQAQNVINMWSRVRPRSQARGAWFYNAELLPQLMTMKIGTGTSATLVFMPPGGLSQSPYGYIFGRPAIPLEQASAPGDVGDLGFLDLERFRLITKGGMRADSSPQFRFIYWEETFRWSMSINGAPRDKSALTPAYGTATTSPFVFLEAR